MLTVPMLCAQMSDSGRKIKSRTIKDWWKSGILPKPQRKRPRYGGGTETYWPQSFVFNQAKTACDILNDPRGRMSKEDVLIRMWLLGFKIDHIALKRAICGRIKAQSVRFQGQDGDPTERISLLAEIAIRNIAQLQTSRKSTKDAFEETISILLDAYVRYAPNELLLYLEENWPHIRPIINIPENIETNKEVTFEHLKTCFEWLRSKASLPAQILAVSAVTDYQLCSLRRSLKITKAIFKDVSAVVPAPYRDSLREMVNLFLLEFGPIVLPIIISSLNDPTSMKRLNEHLFDFLKFAKSNNFKEQSVAAMQKFKRKEIKSGRSTY